MASIPFTQDGINYLLNDSTLTAAVTGRENETVKNIIIEETIDYDSGTYTVTEIGKNAFNSTDIVTLTIPDTIKAIRDDAFRDCSDLGGNLILPAGLEALGVNAFLNCSNLTGELVIPKCVEVRSQRAFQDCSGFSSIRIEDGATTIPDQIAMNCTGLGGDLLIPDSVLFIGTSSFNGCSGLDGTLTLGENIETIQGYAFNDCNFTNKIKIPDSVTFLYGFAFNNASVDADSFKKLVNIDFDLHSLLGLPDTAPLAQQLEEQYQDTVTGSTDKSIIYKSANADEIEINYAQSNDEGYDIVFVVDISDSMQNSAETILDSVENIYPRMVYTTQILDRLSAKLLDTDFDNRIAVTTFTSTSKNTIWNTNGFISDFNDLHSLIWDNFVWYGGQTNYDVGLSSAIDLINARDDTSRKTAVIFLSDGRPNEGNKDADGIYGGNEAQTLRDIGTPLYPVSIFLSDAELQEGRAALTAISHDKNTYYEARDVETFQTIITEIIGDAIAAIEATVIIDGLSQYFELATGTAADLSAGCGSAVVDGSGRIEWDLSGCGIGEIHTLNIKIKVIDDEIPHTDDYPTNESLTIEDPYDTEVPRSPEVRLRRELESTKEVTDADGDGVASPGEGLSYTIKAENKGEVSFNNLQIKDTLEGVLPYVEDTDTVSVTVDIGGTVTTKTIQELIGGFYVNLAAGEILTVTFGVTVRDTLNTETVTVIANRAEVGDTAPGADIRTTNNPEIAAVKMVRNTSGMDINRGTVRPGDIFSYSIRATALSLDSPTGPVTIIDEIPELVDHMGGEVTISTFSGETFKAASTFSGNVMSVSTGYYLTAAGDWVEVKFDVRAKENSSGNTVYNKSTVNAGVLFEETNITEVGILQLDDHPVKEVSETSEAGQNGSRVRAGELITYRITYKNYTAETAAVVITDRLALGVDFVSADNNGIYNESNRTVTWTAENVPGDASGAVSVTVRVNRRAEQTVGNYALVRAGNDEVRLSNYVENPVGGLRCPSYKQAAKCRTTIKGQKIWADNGNAGNTRPPAAEIILLRDGEVYKSVMINGGNGSDNRYEFYCLPVWKNSLQKYNYQIDETAVPGYEKTTEGYNVINTLIP